MATPYDQLPEGTDAIIEPGGSVGSSFSDGSERNTYDAPAASAGASADAAGAGGAAQKAREALAGLSGQAGDKARDFAIQGKGRAIGALDNVVKLIDDAAAKVDDTVGEQYGAYARRASSVVSDFTDTLRNKDIDDLVADARDVVRKSPAIALGTAAALGFAMARLIRAGLTPAETETTGAAAEPPRTGTAPPTTAAGLSSTGRDDSIGI